MSAPAASLASKLQSPNLEERRRTVEELARNPASAVPVSVALVQATADDDDNVRQWATSALEDMGPPASGDCQALAELLAGNQADPAYWAATLLGRLGQSASPAANCLTKAAQAHGTPAVRRRAAWDLEQMQGTREAK